ncbi:unnamed protein product, partial [Brassica rapa]
QLLRGASLIPRAAGVCWSSWWWRAECGGVAVSEIVVYGFFEARLRPLSHPIVFFPALKTSFSIELSRQVCSGCLLWRLLGISQCRFDTLPWGFVAVVSFSLSLQVIEQGSGLICGCRSVPIFMFFVKVRGLHGALYRGDLVLIEFVQGCWSDFLMVCVLIPSPSAFAL